ncbi:MAG: exodeoxyribonuclease VII large subunit [Bacilli bacterium]
MIESNIDITKEKLSVSQVNNIIKEIFDGAYFLKNIKVTGELSSFKKNGATGHYFFNLKDKESSISAVIFSYSSIKNLDSFKDGDQVDVICSVNVFNKRGTYNLIISAMTPAGLGEDLIKKQLLLEQLKKEGLFDDARKKALPKFPQTVAIVTSSTGAAVTDIVENISKRTKRVNILIFDCLVQGKDAPHSIVEALNKTKNYKIDVLIIGRGGGSKEDLSAFDDEMVVRTLASITVPKISAIGHEIDTTVSDFVADIRTSTPTGAAVAAVPRDADLLDYIKVVENNIDSSIKRQIENLSNRIKLLSKEQFFNNFSSFIDTEMQKLTTLDEKLEQIIANKLSSYANRINVYNAVIEKYNPDELLKKGFALIKDQNKHILFKYEKLKENDILYIETSNYLIKTNLISKEKKNGNE